MKRIFFIGVAIFLSGRLTAQSATAVYTQDDSVAVYRMLVQGKQLHGSNAEKAMQLVAEAATLAEKGHFTNAFIEANMLLGQWHFDHRSYLPALSSLEKAKAACLQTAADNQLGLVYKLIADVYARRSMFRQANDNYREASLVFRRTNQLKELNECQEALGEISLNFGRYKPAVTYYLRALQYNKALNNTKAVMSTSSKLVEAYMGTKQFDSALYFNNQLKAMILTGSSYYYEAVERDIIIYSFQGNIPAAEKAKEEAGHFSVTQTELADRVGYFVACVIFYTAKDDEKGVQLYLDSSSRAFNRSLNPEAAFTGLGYLAELRSMKGNYKGAYEAERQAGIYKDIFRNREVNRMSAEADNVSEIVLQEKQIEYLNLVNKLKAEQLSKEELQRMALLRENILKDSSLANQQLLMEALASESGLRQQQLQKEKELSLSLSRENELKARMLINEKRSKGLLLAGIGLLVLLLGTIFYQYRKQKAKNDIIRKQSGELEVLNKEIHHRVKNNLQVISSMLDLQSQTLNDEKATAIIKEGMQRVQSMAFIHQNLYQGSAVTGVNMNEYIRTLSTHLFQTYNIRTDKIRFHVNIEDINLHTDTAIPLGMIMNELISNSLKYAFRNRTEGDIWVNMRKLNNELLLQVKDNGEGLPAGFEPEKTGSFGYEIINAFCQKMKARLNIDGSGGTDVQIIVSKFKTTG